MVTNSIIFNQSNNFVNTASVETSTFLVLFIMKLNGLIIKKHIVYACVS